MTAMSRGIGSWERADESAGGSTSDSHELQRILLEAEGVLLDDRGRVNLDECRREPDDRPGRGWQVSE